MDEACNRGSRLWSVGYQDCALSSITAGNDSLDCSGVVVHRVHVLKFDHRIAVAKELGGGKCSGIENHRRHVGGDLCIGVLRCILHIFGGSTRSCVVNLIEENAIDGDIVARFIATPPTGISGNVLDNRRIRSVRKVGVHVAECHDVGEAIQD